MKSILLPLLSLVSALTCRVVVVVPALNAWANGDIPVSVRVGDLEFQVLEPESRTKFTGLLQNIDDGSKLRTVRMDLGFEGDRYRNALNPGFTFTQGSNSIAFDALSENGEYHMDGTFKATCYN
jgi:hypothetical protein